MDVYEFSKNFVCGGVAGASCLVAGHPFDTVKVRLQTMPKPRLGENPLFRGTADCFRKTVSKEGLLALFKGMAVPLLLATPRTAVFFSSFALAKELQLQGGETELRTAVQNFNAGAIASIIRATVMVPSERIKCLLQVQQASNVAIAGAPLYNGPVDVTKKLYKSGDVPGSGVYMATYEYLKKAFPGGQTDQKPSTVAILVAGGIAGMALWTVGIPADVIKSRMQIAPEGKCKNGIREVLREILREEGPKALFKGFTPVMLRAFPANAACFLGLEIALSLFRIFE